MQLEIKGKQFSSVKGEVRFCAYHRDLSTKYLEDADPIEETKEERGSCPA